MGKLKLVIALQYSAFNWEEVKETEKEEDVKKYTYEIPTETDIEVYVFANANFIKTEKTLIEDVVSL